VRALHVPEFDGDEKRPVGRPSKYDPDYHPIHAFRYALLGATDKDLAASFEISDSTLHLWKLEHPEFSESITKGKEEADAKVGSRLYMRAVGYQHRAVKIFCTKGGDIIEAEYDEHHPPDVAAIIFWLKNRQKKNWRDKHEIGTEPGSPIEVDATVRPGAVDISKLSPEQLVQFRALLAETGVALEDPQAGIEDNSDLG